MREIKFRAWLKDQKVMRYNVSFHNGNLWTGYSWIPLNENVELIQYIGLKDKNGVELYDGYILKDDEGRLFVIEYKFGGFNLVPLSTPIECLKDEFSWNPLGDMQTAAFVEESCEVIGNIYENPELLEK